MFNEKDVEELERWEAEYSSADISTFISNVSQAPLGVASKALNVAESLSRLIADVLPATKQDEQWGDIVIGSRFLSVGLGMLSNLTIASHKSNSPLVNSLSKWHSLWCVPHESPIPSEWKLIMECGNDARYDASIHLLDDYTKPFIVSLANELLQVEDTEVISQSDTYGIRYRLKKSEYKTFQLENSSHPFADETSGQSSLIILCPSKEVVIIRLRSGFRVLGSNKSKEVVYKAYSENVLSIADHKVETYKFSSGMSLKLDNFLDKQDLRNDLTKRISECPSKLAFLAIGKPGTGKTQFTLCMAKEVLKEQGYTILIVSINELLRFRPPNWMKKVCLICNDADLLLLSRESSKNRWGSMGLGDVETCMQLLDNTLSKSLVPTRINDVQFNQEDQPSMVYMITSNIEPENIDPALSRPGRIDVTSVFTHVYDTCVGVKEEESKGVFTKYKEPPVMLLNTEEALEDSNKNVRITEQFDPEGNYMY